MIYLVYDFHNNNYIRAGNDNLHLLTSGKRQRLRVDLTDFEGNSRYAEYDNFKVGSACDKYKQISLGTYNGTAGLLDYNIVAVFNFLYT